MIIGDPQGRKVQIGRHSGGPGEVLKYRNLRYPAEVFAPLLVCQMDYVVVSLQIEQKTIGRIFINETIWRRLPLLGYWVFRGS